MNGNHVSTIPLRRLLLTVLTLLWMLLIFHMSSAVKDESNAHAEREAEASRIKDSEAERALGRLRDPDLVVLLDLDGRMWDSEGFACRLKDWQQLAGQKGGDLVFVIAGSLGPGTALKKRADLRWKLSDLTFTHLMTRVLILEQIYRGFMILNGRTYHK